tara:strand:- start:703 stop:993 length:291 start_codon:yes stop_codon:yes gene_type:complete
LNKKFDERRGMAFMFRFGEIVSPSHQEDYDRIIKILEHFSTQEDIELTEEEFDAYVSNKWIIDLEDVCLRAETEFLCKNNEPYYWSKYDINKEEKK